ncbi:hypothetical protein RB620_09735 [Paenibacillus sp. LHD-117]|uniref:hypothetical protein n=1 Tax=Paenibacillus sp. LHD-117 TaxID=3071412 RepID=UPI0027DFD0F2|nr:hypothetical protein [Paenibacillus sp. LHD-117]MDQ6419709.1 hypothetical protein [Paenibacillus sp. LHD-117]
MDNSIEIPKYAGVCKLEEACRIGLPIDDNVSILKRFNYIKSKLYDIMVKHMNRTPEWEVKGAMSLHIWLDAEHITSVRKRVSEMREPPLYLDKIPDPKLETLMNELIYSSTTVELLAGIYGVIRPSLLAAYKEHLQLTNPLVDYPTCRMLKMLALDEEDMIQWGQQALQAMVKTNQQLDEMNRWMNHVHAYLQDAEGITGRQVYVESVELPAPRAIKPFEADFVPRRDERFTDIYNSVLSADELYQDKSRDAKERVWALLYKRLREMDVPEMQCSIVAETKGKPWEYYHDMGRQIWDEARHSMMGQVAFEHMGIDWTKLPIRINFSYELNTMLTPQERHAILYDIEFGLMPGDTGKKYEWNISREAGYALATTFHDHDWADEVLHAQIGRKWIVKDVGGVQETLDMAKKAWKKLEDGRPAYPAEDPDWWQHFYDQVKDIEFK